MAKKNEDILGRVYLITNLVNGKLYVGQTIRSITERWSGHKCDALKMRKDTAICNAIRKYGEENFKVELIEDDISYDELDHKEIYYIEKYNTVAPNGYNISYGGHAYINDLERQRLSDRVKGEKNPMYGACGELNPFYGKTHTDETKEIISQKAKARYEAMTEDEKLANKNRLDKGRGKIISKGGGFKNHKHKEESKMAISNKLKGKKFSEEHNKKISENSGKKQRVVMLNLDGEYVGEFDSMTKACIYLKEQGVHSKAKSGEISNVCRHTRQIAYGYIWVYYNDYIEGNYNVNIKIKRKTRKVICLNNGNVYNSANKGHESTGCSCSSILACCDGKYSYASDSNGVKLQWMYNDEYLELSESEKALLLCLKIKGE